MTYLVQSHHYSLLYEKQKKNEWAKDSFASVSHKVRDLAGQRLGVLGYGSIGRQGEEAAAVLPVRIGFAGEFSHGLKLKRYSW